MANAGANWSTSLNMTSHSPLLPDSTIETPRKLTLKNNQNHFFQNCYILYFDHLDCQFLYQISGSDFGYSAFSHVLYASSRMLLAREGHTPGIFASRMVPSQHLRKPPHTPGSSPVC